MRIISIYTHTLYSFYLYKRWEREIGGGGEHSFVFRVEGGRAAAYCRFRTSDDGSTNLRKKKEEGPSICTKGEGSKKSCRD